LCTSEKGTQERKSKRREISDEVVESRLEYNGNKWRIITLYSQKMKDTMETLREKVEEEDEEWLLIGGDFNARTGSRGGPIHDEEEDEKRTETRKSVDKVVNREGRILIDIIEERGWAILNGSFGKEGGWTYIGDLGSSVIDYVLGNDRAREEVNMVKEGIRTESDHVPLEVELTGPQVMETGRRKKEIELKRSDWTEEGRKEYHEKCEGWSSTQIDTKDIWKEMTEKVRSAITKHKKKIIPWRLGRREWYNKEWKERKKKIEEIDEGLEEGKDRKRRVCEGKKGAQGMV